MHIQVSLPIQQFRSYLTQLCRKFIESLQPRNQRHHSLPCPLLKLLSWSGDCLKKQEWQVHWLINNITSNVRLCKYEYQRMITCGELERTFGMKQSQSEMLFQHSSQNLWNPSIKIHQSLRKTHIKYFPRYKSCINISKKDNMNFSYLEVQGSVTTSKCKQSYPQNRPWRPLRL